MSDTPHLLSDLEIIAELRTAWRDSFVDDPVSRHEEGGYIVLTADGRYRVERWPRGQQSSIAPSLLDRNGCYNGSEVIAAFHTHPNPPVDEFGREWEQSPGKSDQRWHKRHMLRGFVIGRQLVYEIAANGDVSVIGNRAEVLSE